MIGRSVGWFNREKRKGDIMRTLLALALAFSLGSISAAVAEVKITKEISSISVATTDGDVEIKRNQDTNNVINQAFSKTSRKCPPFCIQPHEVAPGVKTVGELEVINFLKAKQGILIDARTVEWHVRGTIPSSKNIPFTEIAGRLDELGENRYSS
jgi:hypothetical protein